MTGENRSRHARPGPLANTSPAIILAALWRGLKWQRLRPWAFVLASAKIPQAEACATSPWQLFSSNNSGAGRRRPMRRRSSGNSSSAAIAASADANSADVIVVNTCTVTAAADLQARQAIRTIHRENPAARIIVTGCYAQRAPRGTCCAPRRFLGRRKFAQAGNSAPDSGNGAGNGARIRLRAARQGFVPLSMIASEALPFERRPGKNSDRRHSGAA